MKTLRKAFLLLMAVALFATILMLPAVAEDVTIPDPIAWYSFEDDADFGKDSMDTYHLDCSNGQGFPKFAAAGAVGNALYLDGDYCYSCPVENDLSEKLKSFTLSYYAIRETRIGDFRAWESPVSIDDFCIMHRIDGGDNDFMHITFDPNDWWNVMQYPQYSFTANLNMYTVTAEIANGKTEVKYYLNTELIGTKNFDYELNYASVEKYTFTVGSQSNADMWYYGAADGKCFTGVIDEVRVWNSVLTAEQIAKVFTTDNPDGTTKDYDTVFGLSFEIPDDTTKEDTSPADDTNVTTDNDSETENKPAESTSETPVVDTDKGDDSEGGLSSTVIIVIVVAAVLVVAAVILGVISTKKRK